MITSKTAKDITRINKILRNSNNKQGVIKQQLKGNQIEKRRLKDKTRKLISKRVNQKRYRKRFEEDEW